MSNTGLNHKLGVFLMDLQLLASFFFFFPEIKQSVKLIKVISYQSSSFTTPPFLPIFMALQIHLNPTQEFGWLVV